MHKKTPLIPTLLAQAAALALAAGAAPVFAQTSAPAASGSNAADETIVVTARKRVERLLDVPLSVTAIAGEEIRDRGAVRLSEIGVPNVSFFGVENNSLPNFTVRGVQGQNRPNVGFDSGIGVYVDGVFMGRTAAFNQETFDVERVEFLRGPQGTLFGKNSVAGAISVTTREPGKNFAATGSIDMGSRNQQRLSAYMSSPLGSQELRGSVSVYSGKRDGYVDNLATGTRGGNEDVESARVKLLYKPSSKLDVTVAADSLRDRSVMASPRILAGYGLVAGSGEYTSNVNLPTLAARNVQGVGLTVNYDLGNGLMLTSITSKRKLDTDRTADTDVGPTNIVASASMSKQDQWSQELRVVTNRDAAVTYIAGLYYYQQDVSGSSRSTFGPSAPVFAPIRNTTGVTFGDIGTTSAAAFVNADWNLGKALTLTGGLRYTSEKKNLTYQQDVTFPAFLASSLPREKDSLSTNDLSPLLSLRYKVDRNSMVYATYSRGFRSGGWNVDNVTAGGPTSFAQTRFKDEQMTNLELGVKASALGGKLSGSAALFSMDYSDMQLTRQVAVLGGGGATVGIVTNGGKARIEGAELEATLRPMSSLRLTAALGYTDARYRDYSDLVGTSTVSFNGNRLNFAPRLNSNVAAVYSIPLSFGWLGLRADYSYTDGYYIGRENLASQFIPRREIINARISLAGEKWEVALYGKNVTDKRYIVMQGRGGFAAPVGAGTNTLVDYGPPRSYGVVGTYTF